MKKIALTSLLAVFAISAANAATSHFIGGSAWVQTDKAHNSILNIAPEFGWNYNADWDFGVAANFGFDHKYMQTTYGAKGETYTYGAGVFARYKVAQFGGAKLLLRGSVDMDFVTLDPDQGDGETLKTINASIVPMVTYDISEAFTLYARLDFLGANAGYTYENKRAGIQEDWNFGIGVDSDTVANTGNFQIGFTYNF